MCRGDHSFASEGVWHWRLPVRHGSQAAFNLVEIVIALGISTMILVAVLGVFPIVQRSLLDTDNETKAGLLAQTIFSTLRADFFDDVDLFGLRLNLNTENNEHDLYADNDLNITTTLQPTSRFLIHLKFNTSPAAYPKANPADPTLLNQVSMVIYWNPPARTLPNSTPAVPNTNKAAFTGLIVKGVTRS